MDKWIKRGGDVKSFHHLPIYPFTRLSVSKPYSLSYSPYPLSLIGYPSRSYPLSLPLYAA
jgi:hypothetical protein